MKHLIQIFAGVLLLVMITGCNSDNPSNSGNPSDSGNGSGSGFIATRQINVVSREPGSGTRGAFIEVLGIQVTGDDGSVRDLTTIDAEIAPSTSAVLTSVAGDSYSISYISLGSLNDSVRALDINGVPATTQNVQNGTYPLFRTFYFAVPHEVNDLTQEFLTFVMSREGQEIVARDYVQFDPNAPEYVPTEGLSGTIVIQGSTSIFRLMERFEEAFEAIHENVNVEVHSMGSTAGILAAINGTADLGMTSRELRESELVDVNPLAMARDGLAVIVNHDNTLTGIDADIIRQIFIGELTRWNEVID